MRRCTYNGYLSAKLILDLTLLIRIWTFILDDLEELLDTHLCGGCRSVLLQGLLDNMGWKFESNASDAIDRACFARPR